MLAVQIGLYGQQVMVEIVADGSGFLDAVGQQLVVLALHFQHFLGGADFFLQNGILTGLLHDFHQDVVADHDDSACDHAVSKVAPVPDDVRL